MIIGSDIGAEGSTSSVSGESSPPCGLSGIGEGSWTFVLKDFSYSLGSVG